MQAYYDGEYDWNSVYVEATKENWNPNNKQLSDSY